MHFRYLHSLYLLIGLALLIGLYLWSHWKRKTDLQGLGDWRLIQDLFPLEILLRRRKKDLIALVGFSTLLLAALGPQFGSRLKEVQHRGVDVFIAVDTSRSMLAEDVAPSRLERAKRALGLLIRKLEGNRIGIIAFAKYAVIQCPLTVDNEAAKLFLDILSTNAVPVQGTSLGGAIRLALKSFREKDNTGKALVLLTDGEDHASDPLAAAKQAKEKGVKIFTIGIGTTKGEVIKEKDERGKVVEFHKYKGELVLSRLDDALLSKIASLTGGKYYRASQTDKEIDEIAGFLKGLKKKEFSAHTYERLVERYQFFAIFGLFLLFFEFLFSERRGQGKRMMEKWRKLKKITSRSIMIVLFPLLFFPRPASANIKSHVRKGNRMIKKKDFPAARAEFENARVDAPEAAFLPYNIATTYYLEGQLKDAKTNYEQALTMARNPQLKSKIAYNLGHVLFSMGQKEEAISRFKECLKFNPSDRDAKYNIEYIKAGHKPKRPPKQQKQKKGKNQQGSEKQKKGEKGKNKSTQEKRKRKGDISKEDAERILQMIQDQEKEGLKNSKPIRVGTPQKEKDKQAGYEDW